MNQLIQIFKARKNHSYSGRYATASALVLLLAAGTSIGSRTAIADNVGYWTSSADNTWTNGFGECWHGGNWTADMATATCDANLMAQAEPTPEPKELDADNDSVADSRDYCAGTPSGAQVDGRGCALDGDGDGIANHNDRCANTPLKTNVNDYGCPVAGTRIFTIDGVHFAFDRAELRPEARSTLDEAVQVLRDNQSVTVAIAGHTDSTGSDAYNQGLSERRAQSVNNYMVAHGIDTNRLRVYGRGEGKPVTTNQTREGRTENRRVEFVVEG